jgi:hypothetical protein
MKKKTVRTKCISVSMPLKQQQQLLLHHIYISLENTHHNPDKIKPSRVDVMSLTCFTPICILAERESEIRKQKIRLSSTHKMHHASARCSRKQNASTLRFILSCFLCRQRWFIIMKLKPCWLNKSTRHRNRCH